MKSFEHGYFYEMPISHGLVSSMRLLGEFKGRAGLRCVGRGPGAQWEKLER